MAFVHAGTAFGTAVSLISSGYLIDYFGWPTVFYGTGGLTLIWTVLWFILVSGDPAAHPSISEDELKYILNSTEGSSRNSEVGVFQNLKKP